MTRPQQEFDIDATTGFFPNQPLHRLSGPYQRWEQALSYGLSNIRLGEETGDGTRAHLIQSQEWRLEIYNTWPILRIEDLLTDKNKLRRAHLVLAWLVHLYVHSLPPTEGSEPKRVPASLAVPLVQVSQTLGIAPVLTFADTVLWNWELINPERGVTIDNMRFLHAFSGTEDELNFYRLSATVELHGVQILQIIDSYNNLRSPQDLTSISKISRDLGKLATVIEELARVMQSARSFVDPHVFYWQVRPWFEGSDAEGPSGAGWIYEGVENSHKLDLSGPSAGQSTVMHALDVFLDIDHKLRQRRYPAPSEENKRADHGFMQRMRRYMPGKHRQYLEHLESTPLPIRALAQSTPALREPYNGAVLALKKLRDLHMRVACLYIINMARTDPCIPSACPASKMLENMQKRRQREGPSRGTGGNQLSLLLKAGRDATVRAALDQ
ncbi:Indoleamine 2,3-dioxygenase [Marasmius fiardii PR-910]|nr:Indoleamine 2,3-dioxygenase [Marasmius fiardii PR-910]